MHSTIHAVGGQQKGQNRAKSHVWLIFFFFLVKRAGRHFGFFKRVGRHETGAGRRTLQKKPRQNTGYVRLNQINIQRQSIFSRHRRLTGPPSDPDASQSAWQPPAQPLIRGDKTLRCTIINGNQYWLATSSTFPAHHKQATESGVYSQCIITQTNHWHQMPLPRKVDAPCLEYFTLTRSCKK